MRPEPSGFRALLKTASSRNDIGRTFEGFVRLTACALSGGTREAEYLEEAKSWEKAELGVFAGAMASLILEMEKHPFEDLLGDCYMEVALSKKGQQWHGEFHTPKPICDLMARLTLGDLSSLPEEGPITVCEPACASGAMILSLAEACPPAVRRRLRVTAIDINRTACDMAFVNTTLWGIPTRVIHGNTLSLECWAAWSNIHYIAPWLPLALRPQAREAETQGAPPTPAEVESIKRALGQQQFAFA